ncbi:MAG: hypothetical protein IBX44_00580 [Sulfurospirillum sp.]|nr:hypothetical protein [Sulfurospirillum sp.]
MSSFKKALHVEGASVPFFEYEQDGMRVIEFDSSTCVPPEPMVNAMLGLAMIKDECTKLIMINHKSPMGLYPKIDKNFEVQESKLENGKVKLEIFYKKGLSELADLNDASCMG